jgi:hypothetical protein
MKITLNHVCMLAGALCAAGSEFLGAYLHTGSPMPFHLTSAAALTAVTVLGSLSKSVLADKTAPPATLTADILKTLAASLDAAGPTTLHVAVLDAVKADVAVAAEKASKAAVK